MTLNKPNKAIGPQVRQKPNQRFNLPLIGLALLSVIVSLQIGTQYLAWKFHYFEGLGFSLAHVYLPWQLFLWNFKYHQYYPDYFNAAFGIVVMSTSLFLMMVILVSQQLKKGEISEYLHGSARWANMEDLKNASLIGHDEGVYVGAFEDEIGRAHV